MAIHGLKPHLAEIGKIKIGASRKGKDGKGKQPIKYDHFVVTTTARGEDGFEVDEEIHEHVGARPTKLDVVLPYEDPERNLLTSLACYDGSFCFCRGDGLSATWFNRSANDVENREVDHCPCVLFPYDIDPSRPRVQHPSTRSPQPEKGFACKTNGILRVILVEKTMTDGHLRVRPFEIGGVHVFRTTSKNSIQQLQASMTQVKTIVGRLSYIPLVLAVRPRQVRDPVSGRPRTIYVLNLGFEQDMFDFMESVATMVSEQAALRSRIIAPGLPSGPSDNVPQIGDESPEEQAEFAAEFYPCVGDAEAEEVPAPADDDAPSAIEEPPDGPTPEDLAEEAQPTPEPSPPPQSDYAGPGPTEAEGAPRALPRLSVAPPDEPDDAPATPERRKAIIAIARDLNYHDDDVKRWMADAFGARSTQQLRSWQALRLVEALEAERTRRAGKAGH